MTNHDKNMEQVVEFAKRLQLARVSDIQDTKDYKAGRVSLFLRAAGDAEIVALHAILNEMFKSGKVRGEEETEDILKGDIKLLMYDNDKLKTIIKNLEEDCQVHRSAVAVLQSENAFYKKRNDTLLTKLKMKKKRK